MVSKRNFLFKRVSFSGSRFKPWEGVWWIITNRNYESLIGIPVNPQKYYDLFLLFVSSENTWLVFQKILDVLKLSMSREDQTIHAKVNHFVSYAFIIEVGR